jgi:hypothetical protein
LPVVGLVGPARFDDWHRRLLRATKGLPVRTPRRLIARQAHASSALKMGAPPRLAREWERRRCQPERGELLGAAWCIPSAISGKIPIR